MTHKAVSQNLELPNPCRLTSQVVCSLPVVNPHPSGLDLEPLFCAPPLIAAVQLIQVLPLKEQLSQVLDTGVRSTAEDVSKKHSGSHLIYLLQQQPEQPQPSNMSSFQVYLLVGPSRYWRSSSTCSLASCAFSACCCAPSNLWRQTNQCQNGCADVEWFSKAYKHP